MREKDDVSVCVSVNLCACVSKLGLENLNLTLQEMPLGKVADEPQFCTSFDLLLEIQTGNGSYHTSNHVLF